MSESDSIRKRRGDGLFLVDPDVIQSVQRGNFTRFRALFSEHPDVLLKPAEDGDECEDDHEPYRNAIEYILDLLDVKHGELAETEEVVCRRLESFLVEFPGGRYDTGTAYISRVDLEGKDWHGCSSPLISAVSCGREAVVDVLLRHGLSVDAAVQFDIDGYRDPLHVIEVAESCGNENILRRLREHSTSIASNSSSDS